MPQVGIVLSGTACAIIGLSFLGGSYMAEAFRGGFDSIEETQMETGLSLGLTRMQLLIYIVFPQALSVAIPQLSANIIFLIKETLLLLTISYLIILLPISIGLRLLERRLRHAEHGH